MLYEKEKIDKYPVAFAHTTLWLLHKLILRWELRYKCMSCQVEFKYCAHNTTFIYILRFHNLTFLVSILMSVMLEYKFLLHFELTRLAKLR